MNPQFALPKEKGDFSSTPVTLTSAWELIQDVTLSAIASQIDLTGLDGDTDEVYWLAFYLRKATTPGLGRLNIRLNGDSGANYNRQLLEMSGAALPASRTTADTSMLMGGSTTTITTLTYNIKLMLRSGARRYAICHYSGTEGPGISEDLVSAEWTNTVDNVTQISLFSDTASDLDIGTQASLFRKVA